MAYRSLLRVPSAGFFPLGFLARLPYATSSLATLILVRAASGSYAFAGLAAAAQGIANALGAPVAGALADRHGHRLVGAVAALANAGALTGLVVAGHTGRPGMIAAAALAGLTQPPVGSLVRVHWSRLLHARERPDLVRTALSYEATADEISFVAGPAIVGLLTALGPTAPTVAAIALLLLATLPFTLSLAPGGAARQEAPGTSRTPLPRLPLAVMFLAMAAMGTVFGAVQTGVTAYADDSGRPGSAGLLYALFGVGSALAGAACAWLPARFTLLHRYVTFAATLLLGTLTLVAGDGLHAVPAAMAVAGVTVAPYMISLYTLTERLAPADRATAALTILCAGGPLGTATGQALAGYLADRHGPAGAFLLAPAAAMAALLLAVAVFLADTDMLRPGVRVAVGSGTPESGGMGRAKGRTHDGDER
ncbi:MFS transporter [Streptomyces sp. MBT53]|uniref:MFS transporter n=1 Tax=Streptomyces sp. MBT53 TaxID=1488384 RepID=UPI0019113F5B|nr:MFS transporter [Streptomyces sp. MBT53]MBK6013337.1 MFS transporter [Streptomyces sp. MBT53]